MRRSLRCPGLHYNVERFVYTPERGTNTYPALQHCTKNKNGRLIERREFQPYVENNRLNIEKNPATYKKLQAIVEHTYGIRVVRLLLCERQAPDHAGQLRCGCDVHCFQSALVDQYIDQTLLKQFLGELALLLWPIIALLKPMAAPITVRLLTP